MTPKLYRCEVTFVYYAIGDSPEDARGECREALADTPVSEMTEVEPFQGLEVANRDGWSPEALVYGTQQDLTLLAAVKQCAS